MARRNRPYRLRYLRRYRQIGEALLKHGFGFLIDQLELRHLLPFRRRLFRRGEEAAPLTVGVRLRLVFEELGPTFVKLGQLLSTRADLLPKDVTDELTKLQDDVAPFPADEAIEVVEEELGRPVDVLFAAFERVPLAAASISQVHRAVLHTGEKVAVKIRRPGIERQIETDVQILLGLAELAKERLRPDLFDPVAVVEEFARTIRREMDFRIEARHLLRFRDNFASSATVHIPEVHWRYTTERLLVTEFIEGVKVTDKAGLKSMEIDPAEVARKGAEAFLKQVMLDGMFHGDPHPGNVLVMPDGRLAFLDFGVVGQLDDRAMESLADMLVGVVKLDANRVVGALHKVGAVDDRADTRALKADLNDLVERNYGKPLKEMELGPIVAELFSVINKHRLKIPLDFALLGKAIVTMEGIGKQLDPDFNAVEIAEPFARRLIRRRLDPKRVARQALKEGREYIETLGRIPPAFERALSSLNRGELEIVFTHKGLDRFISKLDVVSNRVSLAVVIGSLIVGSSLIVQTRGGPEMFGLPLFGVLGYIVAGLFGIFLIISILRSGRF